MYKPQTVEWLMSPFLFLSIGVMAALQVRMNYDSNWTSVMWGSDVIKELPFYGCFMWSHSQEIKKVCISLEFTDQIPKTVTGCDPHAAAEQCFRHLIALLVWII